MLRSLYVMMDYHLDANDGVQGTVQDFLFDDESWIVYYLVAETPSTLGKRKVLILPFVVGRPDWELKRVPVRLNCEEIRTSPPLASDPPLSTQYEAGLKRAGSHLRSMRELLGYAIHARDGEVGILEDFIVEDTLWGVQYAVVGLKLPLRGSIIVRPESIQSISWTSKAAWVNLTREQIAHSPKFDPSQPVNRGGDGLYDYYGRPVESQLPLSSR
jgi:hypothetical protein